MKEIWNQKLDSFQGEIDKASKATGEPFTLSEEQKGKTLKEFLKTDKARLRAFLSILKHSDAQDSDSQGSGLAEDEKIQDAFSKELKILRMLDSVDLFVKQYEEGGHSTLEPRQVESLVKIAAFLRSGNRCGYLELPTGLGKTVIFAELIEALKDVPGLKILVVGSGNINVMQNTQKLERFGGGKAGQYFGGKKELHATVTACNYHGLRSAIDKGDFKSGDFDLVVLDEVHDGLGEVTQESIEKTFKDETIIGFSATATQKLYNGRSVSDFLPVEIDKMGVVEAVKENLLSAFKVEVIQVPIVVEGISVAGGDYVSGELGKKLNTLERNNLVVDSYIEFYRRENSKAIAFCVARVHTKDLAAAFEAKGIHAGILTGKLNIDEREAVLQKWKNGDIEVLCGSKLSWQGLDETEATVGLNVAPSLSEKDVIQRGGRLLRRSEKIDRKSATIVEFLDEWRGTKNRPRLYSEVLETAGVVPDKWLETSLSKEPKEGTPAPGVVEEDAGNTSVSVGAAEQTGEPAEVRPYREEKEIGKKVTRYSDAREVMAISNQNRKFRNEGYFEYAPQGWMSANIIAVELGTSTREVEAVISAVQESVSLRKFRINSGVHLSALGIKRTFFGPPLLDEIYTRLVGSPRSEKIQSGVLKAGQNLGELEQASVEREKEANLEKVVDLEWRDYDILPSFTMEGDSVEDEEQGTAVGDTSELHAPGEPIAGKQNDLIGYRYQTHAGKIFNSRQTLIRPTEERILRRTKRYGVHPDADLVSARQDFRTEVEEREEEKVLMDIISSPDILTDRERTVVSMLYLQNDEGGHTLASIAQQFGRTGTVMGIALKDALKKIRRAVAVYESTGRISLNTFEKKS
ncbi:MAG: hypothetical protein EXS51_02600 [Candidatus Taylorbacteria bacterium]|nr:hypothetical protein [Candidatus Taylorbacteria bacterium]